LGARSRALSFIQETIMLAQFVAKRAAVHPAACGSHRRHFRILFGLAAALNLGGCLPATLAAVGADPADPNAKVAATTYRSTTAPYAPMRPTTPTAWGGGNGAPASGTDR
jgi:hypothetical protein